MLYTFFLRTGKTLDLPSFTKLPGIVKCPQFCSSGSKLLSYIIDPVNQIVPLTTYPDKCSYTPLFFLTTPTGDMLTSPHGKFYMVFYPNVQAPPSITYPNAQGIINEYWKCIVPMPLCYDAGGYYLGTFTDDNIVLFEIVDSIRPECWICPVEGEFNQNLRYGTNFNLAPQKIYVRASSKK